VTTWSFLEKQSFRVVESAFAEVIRLDRIEPKMLVRDESLSHGAAGERAELCRFCGLLLS
jgi:hypothetical protein